MKAFFDLIPVILFFVVYKKVDIYMATKVLMIAMTLQLVGVYLVKKTVERMFIFIWLTVIILGGLSLGLHDDKFIMWKPTLVNWVFAVVFLCSSFFGKKNLVHRMMGEHFDMSDKMWARTNLAWVLFFFICGALNIVVAHSTGWTSEGNDTWMNFKLFGLTGMSIVFMIGLVISLKGYLVPMPEEGSAKETSEHSEESSPSIESEVASPE